MVGSGGDDQSISVAYAAIELTCIRNRSPKSQALLGVRVMAAFVSTRPARTGWQQGGADAMAKGVLRRSNAARTRFAGPAGLRCGPSRDGRAGERSNARIAKTTAEQALDAAKEYQDDDDDKNDPQGTGRTITPAAAVSPGRERSDEKKNQHDQQNGPEHLSFS